MYTVNMIVFTVVFIPSIKFVGGEGEQKKFLGTQQKDLAFFVFAPDNSLDSKVYLKDYWASAKREPHTDE